MFNYKKLRYKKIFNASLVMFGSIVGAGVLGIPYVVAQIGWWAGFVYLIFIGLISLILNLVVSQISSQVKGCMHFPGYAEKYLGKKGKTILFFSFLLSVYGALLAYIIAQGEVLFSITNYFTPVVWSILFFIIFSVFVWIGISFLEKFNFVFSIGIIVVLFIIIFLALPSLDYNNLNYIDLSKIALPYGVILFAFAGTSVIPTVEQMVDENEDEFILAVLFASILPIILYALFTLAVVGVTGLSTTEVATIGLGTVLGKRMLLFGNIFAFLAMATSFLTLGVTLKNLFQWDYKINKFLSALLTLMVPFIIFILGLRSFISVLSFVGSLTGGIVMITSVMIFWKIYSIDGEIKIKHPLPFKRLIGWLLIIVAILGFVSSLSQLF